MNIQELCQGVRSAESFLTVKDFEDRTEYFTFRGVATTPKIDMVGDIVEPMGAEFALPVKLFSKHDTKKPIGNVTFAKLTASGIPYEAKIPKVKEAGAVRDRVDEAIHEIKYGLVSNVSIGFKPIADAIEALKTGGIRFKRWKWVELSLAPVPANDEATITGFKAITDQIRFALDDLVKTKDDVQRALSGKSATGVVRLDTAPGAPGKTTAATSGNSPNRSTGATAMPTIHERISKWEAKRAADVAARSELLKKAEDDGDRTLTEDEASEHDRLGTEVKEIDGHLARLRDEAETVKATASTVDKDAGTDPGVASAARAGVTKSREGVQTIMARDNIPKELVYVRHVKCELIAHMERMSPLDIAKAMYPGMTRLQNVFAAEKSLGMSVQKANVTAFNVGDAAGGGALAQYQLYSGDFVEWLRPQTIIGQFGQNGIPALQRVPFMVSIAGQTSGGSGYWVGEGKPKPLTSFAFNRQTLGMTKVAGIAVVTEEQLRASTPAADTLLANALRGAIVERIDRDFIDPDAAGSAGVQPASITYGSTGSAASGTINSAVVSDLNTLMTGMVANNLNPASIVLIMSTQTAFALSIAVDSLGRRVNPDITMQGGRLNGVPVIVSQYAAFGGGLSPASNGIIVAVDASEIWLADDGQVRIDSSTEASLQMLDNPSNDTVTPTATTMVSMYQTNSVAIRAERFINWARRRPNGVGVAYLTNVAYSGLPS